MTAYHSNPLAEFVHPHFSRKNVDSFEDLEYADYCHVLLKNYDEDRPRKKGVLFDRVIVSYGINRDIAYCKDLRNRYNHLQGGRLSIAPSEEFSDIVVVRRTVSALIDANSKMDLADGALLERLETLVAELTDKLAPSSIAATGSLPPDDGFSERQKTELREMLTDFGHNKWTGDSLTSEVEGSLASAIGDLRAEVQRQSDGMKELLAKLGSASAPNRPTATDTVLEEDFLDSEEPTDDASFNPATSEAELYHDDGLSVGQAHWILQNQLREQIWSATGRGPSADGLLRRRMIEAFLQYLPRDESDLLASPIASLLDTVAPEELAHLPDVIAVLRRVHA